MANDKHRYINTKFWNDSYVSGLDPIEKLLFMYFLSNGHTNISGIYELPLKIIAIETGIDESMLKKILPRLSEKIRYIKGFVIIKKFLKHQELSSPFTLKGVVNCLKDLDEEFLKDVINKGYYDIDDSTLQGVYRGYTRCLTYSDSNLYLDSNSKKTGKPEESGVTVIPPISQVATKEFYGEFQKVKLTSEEYSKIVERFGEKNTKLLIDELDTYIASKGKKYSSHYATILNWARRKYNEHREKKDNNKYNVGIA